MIWALLSALLCLLFIGVNGYPILRFIRIRKHHLYPIRPMAVTILTAAERPKEVTESSIYSGVSSLYSGHITFKAGCFPHDNITQTCVDKMAKVMQGAEIIACPAIPSPTAVPGSALAISGLGRDRPEVVATMMPSARPTSRTLPQLIACFYDPTIGIVSGIPIPTRESKIKGFIASILCDLTPVLFTIFGSCGIPPIFLVAHWTVIASTISTPLTMNRPSLGSAILMSGTRNSTEIVPIPVPCSIKDPPTLISIMFEHLMFLSRVSWFGLLILSLFLLSIPVQIVILIFDFGSEHWMFAFVSLFTTYVFMGIYSMTWVRKTRGFDKALVAILFAPIRYLICLLIMSIASLSHLVVHGEQTFIMRRGGVLSPISRKGEIK